MREVSADEYRALASADLNFMQTVDMVQARAAREPGTVVHFLQLDSTTVVALVGQPFPQGSSHYYLYDAFYADPAVLDRTTDLATWCQDHRGLLLEVNPYLILNLRNNDSTVSQSIDLPVVAGARHLGLATHDVDAQKRWQYVVNLSDNYLSTFKGKVRTALKDTARSGVVVRDIGPQDLDEFCEVQAASADRRGFLPRNQAYYTTVMSAFGDKAYGLLAEINTGATISTLRERINSVPIGPDHDDIVAKIERQIGLLDAHSGTVTLHGGFFIETPHETVYLTGGGPTDLMAFNGVYAVVNEAMKRSLSHGVRRFNMMGFFPDFSRSNGLLEFKKQYNGHIEELVGTYVSDLRPIRYFLSRVVSKTLRTLKRGQ